jgi:hypothetical protein
VAAKPSRWALSELRSKVSSPPVHSRRAHRRQRAGQVIVAQQVVEGVVEAGDPVEGPDRARQGAHVGAMQGRLGQRGPGAREHAGRHVAARAVVAAAHEGQQALAGPAAHVEDAAAAEAVPAGQRLEALEPDVVAVVARELVAVGRERGVCALGGADPHRNPRAPERCKEFQPL